MKARSVAWKRADMGHFFESCMREGLERVDFLFEIMYNILGPICGGWPQRYFHRADSCVQTEMEEIDL